MYNECLGVSVNDEFYNEVKKIHSENLIFKQMNYNWKSIYEHFILDIKIYCRCASLNFYAEPIECIKAYLDYDNQLANLKIEVSPLQISLRAKSKEFKRQFYNYLKNKGEV
jgi:hypothetical protein